MALEKTGLRGLGAPGMAFQPFVRCKLKKIPISLLFLTDVRAFLLYLSSPAAKVWLIPPEETQRT